MDWNKRFFLLLILVTVFRLVYLLIAPLDLVADESYYWDWSRQLDWGYFSKPPMVAWVIALFSRTFGSCEAAVRLPAVILGTVSSLAVFFLARRMYDSRTAFWVAAAGMASPGAAALGFIMTIDAPLICFWSVALYMFWVVLEKERYLRTGKREAGEENINAETRRHGDQETVLSPCPASLRSLWEWWVLTASIGLGLLSKQVMVSFIALMFVFAVVSREDRRLLKSPRPYLFSLLGLSALIPVILWNAHHDWITLHHTAGHFSGSRSIFIATLAEFIGGQLAVVSPFTWLLFVLVSVLLLIGFKSLDRRTLYLLCFSFAPLAAVALLSFRQRIQPNWPAAVYPAGMILLAAWGCGNISVPRLDSWRPFFRKGVFLGVLMALLTYALPFYASAAPGPWADRLVARLQGWRQFGIDAGGSLRVVPNPDSTFLLTFNRQLASELAFYTPGQPRVYNWRSPGSLPENQYDIWAGPQVGWDALLILQETEFWRADAISGYFREIERLDRPSLIQEGRRYSLYLGRSLKKWPQGSDE